MNPEAARQSHPVIYHHLAGETTDELLRAWSENDRTMWLPEAFDVMQALLTERLGHAPPTQGAPRIDVDDELDPDIDEIAAPTTGRPLPVLDEGDGETGVYESAEDEEPYGALLDRLAEHYVCQVCGHRGGEAESGGPARDYAFVACEACGFTGIYKLSVLGSHDNLEEGVDRLFSRRT